MSQFEIDAASSESIVQSFDRIAKELFSNYKLIVNDFGYRLIDIEFYYFAPKVFEDIYVHPLNKQQIHLQSGKWYFHGSGIDITIGNGVNRGGILIRGIAKISADSTKLNYVEEEFHGSLNVVTEIGSKLHGVFDSKGNHITLCNVEKELMGALMKSPSHIIKTKRIGLNPDKDDSQNEYFYNGKFRYVIFPHLKHKNKTQIAKDMHEQYSDMTIQDINNALGSKFL